MRILHVINSLQIGGAEKMLLKLLNSETFSNDELKVVTLLKPGSLNDEVTRLGYEVVSLGFSKNPISLLNIFTLFRVIHEFRPTVIQSWLYQSDLIAGFCGLFFRIPVFWSLRQSNLSHTHNKFTTRIVIGLCALFSSFMPKVIISNSSKAKNVHIARGYEAKKMMVIPNGFDLAKFSPSLQTRKAVRLSLKINDETPLIGIIGRYNSQKNYDGLLKAAFVVLKHVPQAHFCLVGEGVSWSNEELFQKMLNSNLPKRNFHLLGSRNDIPDLLTSFDIFALPSLGESFPNVLGEAMATGLCCVVTDVGDCREIVGHAGFTVDNGNMKDFASVLIRLLNLSYNERSKLGKQARYRISTHYDLEKIAASFRQAYVEQMCDREG